jgi:hypothetical protein
LQLAAFDFEYLGKPNLGDVLSYEALANNSLLAAVSGEIYKMELDGTVIGKFGKPGKQLGEFATVHAIDCRNPDELIVSEITAWRAQKIILKPQAPRSSSTK